MPLHNFFSSGWKKLVISFFIVTFLFAGAPKKTEAFIFVDGIQQAKEYVLDPIAHIASQIILKKLTAKTVNWINSGFQGNPSYVTDPKQFFLDIGDETASSYLSSTNLNRLCAPFKAEVRLALVKSYLSETSNKNYTCSLSKIKDNYEEFMSDFSKGGWDGWFEITQIEQNNPYGSYLKAKNELSFRVSAGGEEKKTQLQQGNGFLSFEKCKPGFTIGPVYNEPYTDEKGVTWNYSKLDHLSKTSGKTYKIGDCLKVPGAKETVTPGSVINDGLTKALGSGWARLEAADEISEIITALVTELINKVTGGSGDGGLRGTAQTGSDGRNFLEDMANEPQPPLTPVPNIDQEEFVWTCDTDANGTMRCRIGSTPPGDQCADSGNSYAGDLRSAMDAVLNENPDIANLPNVESGGRPNARTFLALVKEKLISRGFRATDAVLNGNNNPNTGDLIAVWKDGDEFMERYDAIIGSASTIKDAATTAFEGYVPMNCTTSGGGKDCGCRTKVGDGGGNEEDGEGEIPENPNPGTLFVSSVSPAVAKPGVTTITITGEALTNQVSFYDGSGGRETVVGILNSTRTQTTVLVPASIPVGNATVKIYQGNNVWSNSKLIQISLTGGSGTIITTAPTTTLTPTGIESVGYLGRTYQNGWWPTISPDGKYIAFGNWGDSFVLDLDSGATTPQWNFKKPAGFPTEAEGGGRCMAGQWMSNTKMTFVCELGSGGQTGFLRYEVTAGEWVARKTNDDPSKVLASIFVAKDNNWISFAAPNSRSGTPSRIVKNNQVLASSVGGAVDISGETVVHACTNDNQSICTRTGTSVLRTYTAKTPIHAMAIENNYIIYGGYGKVRGITPAGSDIDLTVAPWGVEGVGIHSLFSVNGTVWVITTSWNESANTAYIFLRPWGSKSVIAIEAGAIWVHAVHKNGNFVIAYSDEVGNLKIITVPANSPRSILQ